MESIGQRVKAYILAEFLPDIDGDELHGGTPLISSGILDSLAVLNLRAWIEDTFDIGLDSHDLEFDAFGSLDDIEQLILSKRS